MLGSWLVLPRSCLYEVTSKYGCLDDRCVIEPEHHAFMDNGKYYLSPSNDIKVVLPIRRQIDADHDTTK
jgi:hypothetical protein